MPVRIWPTAAALALALAATSGCVDAGAATAYCGPADPVVSPTAVAPGQEMHLEVARHVTADGCEQSLPDRARYEVRLTSERRAPDAAEGRYGITLGVLEPNADGDATGTVRVPDDVPLGGAEVSVRLTGAETICEIDPTMQCAKDPFAPIDVTG